MTKTTDFFFCSDFKMLVVSRNSPTRFYGNLQNAAEQLYGVYFTAHGLVCSLRTLCGVKFSCVWKL